MNGNGCSLQDRINVDCHINDALPINEMRRCQALLQQKASCRPELNGLSFTAEENDNVSSGDNQSFF